MNLVFFPIYLYMTRDYTGTEVVGVAIVQADWDGAVEVEAVEDIVVANSCQLYSILMILLIDLLVDQLG